MAVVTLYTRAGCHLCEDAELLLRRLGCNAVLIDVDANLDLQNRYGEQVPVVAIDGALVLSGIIREADLRAVLPKA
jgi:glutaredoxin